MRWGVVWYYWWSINITIPPHSSIYTSAHTHTHGSSIFWELDFDIFLENIKLSSLIFRKYSGALSSFQIYIPTIYSHCKGLRKTFHSKWIWSGTTVTLCMCLTDSRWFPLNIPFSVSWLFYPLSPSLLLYWAVLERENTSEALSFLFAWVLDKFVTIL